MHVHLDLEVGVVRREATVDEDLVGLVQEDVEGRAGLEVEAGVDEERELAVVEARVSRVLRGVALGPGRVEYLGRAEGVVQDDLRVPRHDGRDLEPRVQGNVWPRGPRRVAAREALKE